MVMVVVMVSPDLDWAPVLQRPSLYVATSSVLRGYGGYNGLAGVINTRLYCRIRQINCPRPVYYLPALFIQRVTISTIRWEKLATFLPNFEILVTLILTPQFESTAELLLTYLKIGRHVWTAPKVKF